MQTKEFGKRLRAARERSNLTQERLGMELGVSKTTVSSWELGNDPPRFSYLLELKRVLDVSLDELVYGHDADLRDAQTITTSDDGEVALIKAYRRLTIKRRKALLGLIGE
jgi:transcriptional regulator with XRE-family HTH domain|tara:strand:+ start:205 stop:534 length:330 start_codon:yes stop_codon:yes gene_type:complete